MEESYIPTFWLLLEDSGICCGATWCLCDAYAHLQTQNGALSNSQRVQVPENQGIATHLLYPQYMLKCVAGPDNIIFGYSDPPELIASTTSRTAPAPAATMEQLFRGSTCRVTMGLWAIGLNINSHATYGWPAQISWNSLLCLVLKKNRPLAGFAH